MGVTAFDNLYFQYNQGLLTEENWLPYRAIMKARMGYNSVDRIIFPRDRRSIREVAIELLSEIELEEALAGIR